MSCAWPGRVVLRIVAQDAVSQASSTVSWRSMHSIVAPPPAVSRLSGHTTQRPSRAPVMIGPFVLQHNPPAAGPSRACRSPCAQAGRIVACLSRFVVVSLVVSWPLLLVHARLLCALCHDTVHCIVTKCKTGSSPAYCLHLFFFPLNFFFHSNYWKTTRNIYIYIYIYIYSFSSRTK